MSDQNKDMATELVLKSIDRIEAEVKGSAKKEDIDSLKSEMEAKLEAISVKADEADKRVKELDEKAGRHFVASTANQSKTFGDVFAEAVKENAGNISRVSKGKGFELELKGVGTMTEANNLTGEAVATVQPGAVTLPGNKINLRDLTGTFQSGTGFYVQYRETGGEGAIGLTSAGVAKSQIDYDFTRITYNATYIAGYARIAKEMLQDLPFMQTVLPSLLLRDFYKKENSTFWTDLTTMANGGGAVTAGEDIQNIIEQVGKMEDADYSVNGIVLLPSKVAAILNSKPSDYSLPGTVSILPGGGLSVNGIPVYKAPFATSGYMTMGDWSNARIGVVDGLKVEFFEQDSDNVQKNLITVRVEAREFLAIDDPKAFSHRAFN
jgi:HK97 family phage major capsid protein